MLAIAADTRFIELERAPPDVPAFELGAPHAGAHSLDDQAPFKFGDRTNNDHHCPAQWTTGVELLPERDELDVQPVQLVEHFEEVPGGAGDAIAGPDEHLMPYLRGAVSRVTEENIIPS